MVVSSLDTDELKLQTLCLTAVALVQAETTQTLSRGRVTDLPDTSPATKLQTLDQQLGAVRLKFTQATLAKVCSCQLLCCFRCACQAVLTLACCAGAERPPAGPASVCVAACEHCRLLLALL